MLSSASAVASAIRSASTSPVEFMQRIEKDRKSGLVLPSSDFQRLCVEQLDLFRRIVDPDAQLSVSWRFLFASVITKKEIDSQLKVIVDSIENYVVTRKIL